MGATGHGNYSWFTKGQGKCRLVIFYCLSHLFPHLRGSRMQN